MTPKHPHITVELPGEDDHDLPIIYALFVIGRTRAALRRAGLPKAECDAFTAEAVSGSYTDALATIRRWVTVTTPKEPA